MINRPREASVHLFALGLALLSAGCGAAMSGTFTPPEAGGAAWVEASSPHFILHSDLPADEARDTLGEIERMYAALSDLGFPYEAKPGERMRVVVFRREAEYKVIAPRDSAGFFAEGWVGGETSEPVAVLYGDLTDQTREVIQHELTHRFVRFYYPKAPPWLNEGLAHYFETMAVEDGQAIIGRPAFAFRKGLTWDHGLIPTGQVPLARAIIRLDRGDLITSGEDTGSTSDKFEELKRINLNRAGAWGLVHLLRNGPERYRERFNLLLAHLGEGEPFEVAWDAVFDVGELDQLGDDLTAWLVRPNREVVTLRTAYESKPASIDDVREMPPAEVHLLWSGLRPEMLGPEIEEAMRADPDHPAVTRAVARLLMGQGQWDQAEATLKQALKARPDDPGLLYALFKVYAERADKKNAPPRWREQAEVMIPRLIPQATTVYRQNGLAWTLGLWGRVDEALPLSERSVKTDAGCWECYDTLALLLAQKGALEKAVEVQSLALNLMPERVHASGVYRRLREYRAAVKARAQAEAAEAPPPESPADPQAEAPGLSDSVVRTIVRRGRAGYDQCYAAGLSRDAKLEGKVIVRFVIEKDGAVSGAKDDGSTLRDGEVIACVLGEVQKLRFPPREGGAAAEVVYPLSFSPPDPAGKGAGSGKKK